MQRALNNTRPNDALLLFYFQACLYEIHRLETNVSGTPLFLQSCTIIMGMLPG